METTAKRQFGDFQTPVLLVQEILKTIGPIGGKWSRVLEPTCGQGNFIDGIINSESPPREIYGIEIQEQYCAQARKIKSTSLCGINVVQGNIFEMPLNRIKWETNGSLLIIGNPPWVTNSEIGGIDGNNLPKKNNFKGFRGIDAITGKANFDIAEYIWIKLLSEFQNENASICLLCKTSVARSVLQYAYKANMKVSKPEMHLIDAKRWFGASTDACLFSIELGANISRYQACVFPSLGGVLPEKSVGYIGNHFVSDVKLYNSVAIVEGKCPFEWRQGLKHDAAQVMELIRADGVWKNKIGEFVDVEGEYLYPLIKGSDISSCDISNINRSVIVTQKETGQNTECLQWSAPRLWKYLSDRREHFDSRRSSIYRGKAPFSIFGIGKYSFSKYKVLVSGLHKKPKFIAVGGYNAKPILCDDTCYLIPCVSALQASILTALLNHPLTLKFIKSISFNDSKRPITKMVLSRIDIGNVISNVSIDDLSFEIMNNLRMFDENIELNAVPDDLFDALGINNRALQTDLFSAYAIT